jgi:hypothetical protein
MNPLYPTRTKLHRQQAYKMATAFFIERSDHSIDSSVALRLTTIGMLMALVAFASV